MVQKDNNLTMSLLFLFLLLLLQVSPRKNLAEKKGNCLETETMTLPVPTPFQPDPSRAGPQASAFPISGSQQLDASVLGWPQQHAASPCLGDVSGSAEPLGQPLRPTGPSLHVSTALQQDACVFACSVSLCWD